MTSGKETFRSMNERASKDPIWQKVLQYEQQMPQIKMLFFSGRITETRVFIESLLSLHSTNKENLVHHMMQGVPELVSNPRYIRIDLLTAEME